MLYAAGAETMGESKRVPPGNKESIIQSFSSRNRVVAPFPYWGEQSYVVDGVVILKTLFDQGLISQTDYDAKKQQILKGF